MKTPPTPDRVASRMMALAAVGARALLEQEDPADPGVEQTRQRLLKWIEAIGVGDEMEPDEWKVLQLPLRTIPPKDTLNASWRLEGLAVLAWALNRLELPDHDVLSNPGQLLPSVGILNAERAKTILDEPPLRPAAEIEQMAERQFALHWRLRNFRLKPTAMNFREFAATAWFGPLEITGVRLIDDDLALGDSPIHSAPRDRLQTALSAAMERHRASNWLRGDSVRYSDTDTST